MKAAWLLPLLLFLSVLALPASALPGPLLIILLPGTSLRDWQAADAPHLHQLMATGALAVMNTRTARLPNDRSRETPESALLTLGAGARAGGDMTDSQFLPKLAWVPGVGVNAAALYERRMGGPGNALVNPNWPRTMSANRGRGYDIRLGNLADTLSAAGVKVRAGGGRYAELVGASGSGTVLPSASFDLYLSECLIWDAGSNLAAADTLLASASAAVTAKHGQLLILSPFPSDTDYEEGRRLSPILECGMGIPAGLLMSPSTRCPGLLTNTDFAPTVAAYFGQTTMRVRPFGQVWTAMPVFGSVDQARALEELSYRQARGMKLLPYLAVALAVWMMAGTALALIGKIPALWPLIPSALLLALLFSDRAIALPFLFVPIFLLTWIGQRRIGIGNALLFLLAALSLSMLLDMVTGSHLMRRSLLGYSAVEGARYYGLGNEAMGALVGSLLVLTVRLWRPEWFIRILLSLLLGVTALMLGSSGAGAKAGGLLVSLLAFGSLLCRLWGGKWSPKVIISLLLLTGGAMVMAAVADAFLPAGGHSHMGEAVQRIRTGGLGEAQDIIVRKAAVEVRLAYHSAWAYPLWIGLLCFLALGQRYSTEITGESKGLKEAGIVAVVACLVLNDAGVVAAVLCLIPLWAETAMRFCSQKPLTA